MDMKKRIHLELRNRTPSDVSARLTQALGPVDVFFTPQREALSMSV